MIYITRSRPGAGLARCVIQMLRRTEVLGLCNTFRVFPLLHGQHMHVRRARIIHKPVCLCRAGSESQ